MDAPSKCQVNRLRQAHVADVPSCATHEPSILDREARATNFAIATLLDVRHVRLLLRDPM
jgi:hypothetical protein